jgi:hypothetical protein
MKHSPLLFFSAVAGLTLAAVFLTHDARAALPVVPQVRVRHIEPLCLTSPAASCTASTVTNATPGITSITDFHYGSPLGSTAGYVGPGWQVTPQAQDVVVGDVLAQVDLFCDGTPDVIAAPESAPPDFESYPAYVNTQAPENWLAGRVPYPSQPVGRISSELEGVFIFAAEPFPAFFQTGNPTPVNQILQQVPWAPVDVNTGQRTLINRTVIGGRQDPPSFPPQ